MSKRTHRVGEGFTLIELMIVVVILGILAAVAIVAYNKYVERSHNTEATSILADIRMKQEAYRATFHQYADLSDAGWVPARSGATGWTDKQLWPTDKVEWNQLGVRPDSGLVFSYLGAAGDPDTEPSSPFDNFGINSDAANLDFWFAAMATQDYNGDGRFACFVVQTGVQAIKEFQEGTAVCAVSD